MGTIVTTPHFEASLTRRPQPFRERMAALDAGWEALATMAQMELPDLELGRGVELRMDIPDPDLSDPRVRLAGTRAVLVEFDGFAIPPRAEAVMAGIRAQGFLPVLAHPERYRGASLKRVRDLLDAGVVLQLNAGSLTGRYGPESRVLAWRILHYGMAAAVASDYHGHLPLLVREARDEVTERLGDEAATLLFDTNARRILAGEDPEPLPPSIEKEPVGVLGRITRWLKR